MPSNPTTSGNRFGPTSRTNRTQRYPQYTDAQLTPFFNEVSNGYCFKQATDRAGLVWQTVENTLCSDDETMGHAIDLSLVAGAKIRAGEIDVPDRWDGLYDKYRNN